MTSVRGRCFRCGSVYVRRRRSSVVSIIRPRETWIFVTFAGTGSLAAVTVLPRSTA